MIENTQFSPRDWELAPIYESPTKSHRAVMLDFSALSRLARQELEIGSFRKTTDGTLSRAPLYVDDMPAAFYKVDTSYVQFTPKYDSRDRETLVVLNGVLRMAIEEDKASLLNTYHAGDVIELHEEEVALQAVGLIDPAHCLALALYRDKDIQVIPILGSSFKS